MSKQKWEVVTLYTIHGVTHPEVVSAEYVEKPGTYRKVEGQSNGMYSVVRKADMGHSIRYALTADGAWAVYLDDLQKKRSTLLRSADECQQRINWADAQRRKARLG
jgi:hypothetical protein